MKYREFVMRKITILLVLAVALAFTACDAQSVKTSNDSNKPTPEKEKEEETTPPEDEPDHDDEHDNAADGVETLEVGALSGSWRVATLKDDTPIAHFDIIHVKGESEITGEFLMGVGIHEDLADETGEIIDVTFVDNKIELVFNPTPDEEEFYMISSTERIDDDNFKGTLTSQRNDELLIEVLIARQVSDD